MKKNVIRIGLMIIILAFVSALNISIASNTFSVNSIDNEVYVIPPPMYSNGLWCWKYWRNTEPPGDLTRRVCSFTSQTGDLETCKELGQIWFYDTYVPCGPGGGVE